MTPLHPGLNLVDCRLLRAYLFPRETGVVRGEAHRDAPISDQSGEPVPDDSQDLPMDLLSVAWMSFKSYHNSVIFAALSFNVLYVKLYIQHFRYTTASKV